MAEIVQHYKLGTHVKGRVLNAVNEGYAVGIAFSSRSCRTCVRPFRNSPSPSGRAVAFKILGASPESIRVILVGPMTGGARRDAQDGTAPWARRGSNRGGDGKEKGARSNRGGKADERPANGARGAGAFWKRKKHEARGRQRRPWVKLSGAEEKSGGARGAAVSEKDGRRVKKTTAPLGAGRGGRAADVGGGARKAAGKDPESRGVMNGIRRLLIEIRRYLLRMCMQSHKTLKTSSCHECDAQKKLFSFSERVSQNPVFRSFPPTRRLPPTPSGTPRRALVGRFLPEAHHRDSAARAAMDDTSVPRGEDFAGYNTARSKDLHATLVGNWVEERQLEADTGVFRYKPWVEETPGAADGRERDRRAPGADRHRSAFPRQDARPRRRAAERLRSSAWTSDAKTSHADPSARSGAPFDFGEAVGPRRAAALARMLAEASVEPPARPNDHAMGSHGERGVASVTRSDYDVRLGDYDVRLGARVMYTQDGVYIPRARDATFASETLRKPKGLVDAARLRNGHALDQPGAPGGRRRF